MVVLYTYLLEYLSPGAPNAVSVMLAPQNPPYADAAADAAAATAAAAAAGGSGGSVSRLGGCGTKK